MAGVPKKIKQRAFSLTRNHSKAQYAKWIITIILREGCERCTCDIFLPQWLTRQSLSGRLFANGLLVLSICIPQLALHAAYISRSCGLHLTGSDDIATKLNDGKVGNVFDRFRKQIPVSDSDLSSTHGSLNEIRKSKVDDKVLDLHHFLNYITLWKCNRNFLKNLHSKTPPGLEVMYHILKCYFQDFEPGVCEFVSFNIFIRNQSECDGERKLRDDLSSFSVLSAVNNGQPTYVYKLFLMGLIGWQILMWKDILKMYSPTGF